MVSVQNFIKFQIHLAAYDPALLDVVNGRKKGLKRLTVVEVLGILIGGGYASFLIVNSEKRYIPSDSGYLIGHQIFLKSFDGQSSFWV